MAERAVSKPTVTLTHTEREPILLHTRQGTNGLLTFILSPQYVCIDRYIDR